MEVQFFYGEIFSRKKLLNPVMFILVFFTISQTNYKELFLHKERAQFLLQNCARLWKISFGNILTLCDRLEKLKQLQKSHLLMIRLPDINTKLHPLQYDHLPFRTIKKPTI
ncbi:hypothetical protein AN960_14885 [Bacillus sp. FJAT-25509]|nr:hypothetical protein AN960_14885 [Bacillus sp. FJAT-25509]